MTLFLVIHLLRDTVVGLSGKLGTTGIFDLDLCFCPSLFVVYVKMSIGRKIFLICSEELFCNERGCWS